MFEKQQDTDGEPLPANNLVIGCCVPPQTKGASAAAAKHSGWSVRMRSVLVSYFQACFFARSVSREIWQKRTETL